MFIWKKNHYIELIQQSCLYLIVFSIPLAVCNSTSNPFFIKQLLFYLLTGLSSVLFFCKYREAKKVEIMLNGPVIALSIVLFAFLLATLSSVYRAYSWGILFELFFLTFLFIAVAVFSEKDVFLTIMKNVWIITYLAVLVVADYQLISGQKVSATFGNKNFFAAYILVSLGILAGWVLHLLHQRQYVKMLLYGVLILFGFFFLAVIQSWAAFIGLVVMISVLAGLTLTNRKMRKVIIYAFLVTVTVLLLMPPVRNAVTEQINYDVRPYIWTSSMSLIVDYPVFGTGPGAYFIVYPHYRLPEYFLNPLSVSATRHAHNHYLEVFAETGIIGGTSYIAFILLILTAGIKRWRRTSNASFSDYMLLGMILASIGLLTQNIFSVNLQYPSSYIILWFLLGGIFGYVYLKNVKKKYLVTITISRITANIIRLLSILLICFLVWLAAVKPLVAGICFRKGIRARENQRFMKALEYTARGLTWYPYDPQAWYKLAFLYGMIGNLDSAEETYLYILKRYGDYSNSNRNIGIVFSRKGHSSEAIRYFMKEKTLNPYDINTRCLLASEYVKTGERGAAKEELDEILQLDPKNEYALLQSRQME